MYPEFKAIKRFELIEQQIPATSTATRFQFNDQPQLRSDQDQDVIIQGLRVWNIVDVPLSPNNVAVVSAANLAQTYVVFYIDGEESILKLPLTDLHNVNNFASPFTAQTDLPNKFENLQIDWTKSYLFTPTAYNAGANATFSFLLGVYYKKLPPKTAAKIKANEYYNYCNIQVRS